MRGMPLLLLLVLSLAAPLASAEAPPRLEPLPEIPPPPGMVDPDLEPQVTIMTRAEGKVEEYRVKGRLFMIKVTPPHGRPYFLLDQGGDGHFRRYDDLSPNFQVPLWVIKEF